MPGSRSSSYRESYDVESPRRLSLSSYEGRSRVYRGGGSGGGVGCSAQEQYDSNDRRLSLRSEFSKKSTTGHSVTSLNALSRVSGTSASSFRSQKPVRHSRYTSFDNDVNFEPRRDRTSVTSSSGKIKVASEAAAGCNRTIVSASSSNGGASISGFRSLWSNSTKSSAESSQGATTDKYFRFGNKKKAALAVLSALAIVACVFATVFPNSPPVRLVTGAFRSGGIDGENDDNPDVSSNEPAALDGDHMMAEVDPTITKTSSHKSDIAFDNSFEMEQNSGRHRNHQPDSPP